MFLLSVDRTHLQSKETELYGNRSVYRKEGLPSIRKLRGQRNEPDSRGEIEHRKGIRSAREKKGGRGLSE